MKIDIEDPYFIDKFLVSNESVSPKKLFWGRIILSACVFLYLALVVIQVSLTGTSPLKGIIGQMQVLLSVSMVVGTIKSSYTIAITLNSFNAVLVAFNYFRLDEPSILPGIVLPLITIVILLTIRIFDKGVTAKINKIIKQNEELGMIYEEISATEEELSEQNRQLHDINRTLQRNEEKLNYIALYDSLTELPNRKMIMERLEALTIIAKTEAMHFTLVFIDLDNFKKVNDSLGHLAGDSLLKMAVHRMQSVLDSQDLLGRLGGDEFALIIHRELEENDMLHYLKSVRESLSEPFVVEDSKFLISASFGVASFPQDGQSVTDIMKSADTAMYKAKDQGRNGIQFYNIEMKHEILRRIEFEYMLREAIQNNGFHLVYQPQYKPNPKQIRGIEVLARWHSKTLGAVSPAQFIPIAEDTRLIIPLGEWIMRTACHQSSYIKKRFDLDIIMSINISAVQIMEPTFIDTIKEIFTETGCNPNNIEFEITESVFVSSIAYVINIFDELKQLGVRIALDDFGTGYSSLSYLQRLPIDTLKIDKSFIDSIDRQQEKKPIIGSIISLVHQMDISVIAEGVENDAQLDYLKEQKCDYIQGFLWGKPMLEQELKQLLEKQEV